MSKPGKEMINISKVCITFSSQTETYEKGKNKVKSIRIDEIKGLIRICFDKKSEVRYINIPINLLDSYDYF